MLEQGKSVRSPPPEEEGAAETIQGEKDLSYAISFVSLLTYYQKFIQHVTLFEDTGKIQTDL